MEWTKQQNVKVQEAASCGLEMGEEEQKETVLLCSYGRGHGGKFQKVSKIRREDKAARLACGA